jgi:hypothetical protein
MVGFGGAPGAAGAGRPAWSAYQPHIFNVGGSGSDWGTASQLVAVAATVTNHGGGIEDGYTAMDFALHLYTYRTAASRLFILLTDETRDDIITGIPDGNSYGLPTGVYLAPGTVITNGTNSYTVPSDVTQAGIISELLANQVILASVNQVKMTARQSGVVIGASGISVGSPAYLVSLTSPYYTQSALATVANANPVGGGIISDNRYKDIPSCYYWNVASAVGGTFWDLTDAGVPANLASLTSAFVALNKNQILARLVYALEYWVVNGGTYATNPVTFPVASLNTVDVYLA